MKKVDILETTLRDGSYAINFSFTSSDTYFLCKSLENAGVQYIEVGHGVGLNASNRGYGMAAQTDEEYMVAAKSALRKAKYGMFCIPGIARLKDIDLAADHDMGFIRIGTNVTEIEKSREYIKRAKDYGMFVFANFMKSYALPPEKFAKKVTLSESFGCDVVYVVDSAGGMFPEDVRRYFEEVRKVSNIELAFHGHNNLGLSVANTLEAVRCNARFVDSSLQGLGRSAGNAPTEVLVAALIKKGYQLGIDMIKIIDIGRKYISPILTSAGYSPLDVVSGFADFHSSYMHYIQKYSSKYKINPLRLIIEWTKIDKVDIDEKKLEEVARKIKDKEGVYLGKYDFSKYIGREQEKK